MTKLKSLYSNVQELLREGRSVEQVSRLMDLPVYLVEEIADDMIEFAADFEGNL